MKKTALFIPILFLMLNGTSAQTYNKELIQGLQDSVKITAELFDFSNALKYSKKIETILLQREKQEVADDLIRIYCTMGSIYIAQENQDSAFLMMEQVESLKNDAQTSKTKASLEAFRGYYHWKVTPDLVLADQAFTRALKWYPEEDAEKIKIISNAGHVKHLNGNFRRALMLFEEAIALGTRILEPGHLVLAHPYNNRGLTYMEMGHYTKALEDYQKAHQIRLRHLDSSSFSVFASEVNMGLVYAYMQESERAEQSYQHALAIAKAQEYVKYIPLVYMNMAVATPSSKPEKRIGYYEKCLQAKADIGVKPESDDEFGNIYQGIGNSYYEMGELEKATTFYKKGLDYALDRVKISIFIGLSAIYIDTEDYEQAEEVLQQAKNLALPFIDNHDQLVSDIYYHFSLLEKARKNYKSALVWNDRSIEILRYKQNNDFNEIIAPNSLIALLLLKGDVYMEMSKPEEPAILSALDAYEQAWNLSNYMSKTYQLIEDREAFLAISQSVIEKTLAAYLASNQRNDSYLFSLFEASKASILREAIKESEAMRIAGIPDSLLDIEYFLKEEISHYTQKREGLLVSGVVDDEEALGQVSEKLIHLRAQHNKIKTQFEQDFPKYYELKYSDATISLKELQEELLDEDQTLVEYFIGEEKIYIITVNQKDFHIEAVANDFSLKQLVQDFRSANRAEFYSMNQELYIKSAVDLYRNLLKSVSQKLNKKLIIIPDGILGYIPFESLLVQAVTPNKPYRNYPFLIKEKQISYAYSATLLRQSMQAYNREEDQLDLIAFAPFYDGDTTLIASMPRSVQGEFKAPKPLPFSGEEVYGVQKLVGGKVFYHQEATENRFWEEAPNYRFIHLATHGRANDEAGEYSFLIFTEQKDSIENEYLFVRDLYNINLQADMVVLSACETGVGELKRGEGLISLARGFAYAGAKSIITTLWSIPDQSTKDLMLAFYQNLDEGLDKDEALRQAKLDFILNTKNDLNAHPIFWSGIIAIGDMKKVEFE